MDGLLRIDGRPSGRVVESGAFAESWRDLMLQASRSDTPHALQLFRSWAPGGLSREESVFAELLKEQVSGLTAPAGARPTPQPLPEAAPGGLTVDLGDLSNPARLAPMLRSAASLRGDALRITVPGGRAHLGHFGLGSGERFTGHLLVVRGDANIYGRIEGNLASVEGDVVVHPGAVVTGDVRTAPPTRLLDALRDRIRFRHYSLRTERAYVQWTRRFLRFHRHRHPREMCAAEVTAFLGSLATEGHVSAATQNQALAALLFLYREVLEMELPWLDAIPKAKRGRRLPTVLTREEARPRADDRHPRVDGAPSLRNRHAADGVPAAAGQGRGPRPSRDPHPRGEGRKGPHHHAARCARGADPRPPRVRDHGLPW